MRIRRALYGGGAVVALCTTLVGTTAGTASAQPREGALT
jgi:hypothetical protein